MEKENKSYVATQIPQAIINNANIFKIKKLFRSVLDWREKLLIEKYQMNYL